MDAALDMRGAAQRGQAGYDEWARQDNRGRRPAPGPSRFGAADQSEGLKNGARLGDPYVRATDQYLQNVDEGAEDERVGLGGAGEHAVAERVGLETAGETAAQPAQDMRWRQMAADSYLPVELRRWPPDLPMTTRQRRSFAERYPGAAAIKVL